MLVSEDTKRAVRAATQDAQDRDVLPVVRAVSGVSKTDIDAILAGGDVDDMTWYKLSVHLGKG